MNTFLLVDLDDTLLVNPIKEFMPAYIGRLAQSLSSHVDPQKMVKQLLNATDRMINNNNPYKTLEEVFDENFYPALGLKKDVLQETILGFYAHQFNELQEVTSPIPEARSFIETAREKGSDIVVATNPLFPLTAMQARLNWAGFQEPTEIFSLITSYERMHFAKPNPAYYAEILGLHGWPQVPCGMVGNSLKDDIQPAAKVGLAGYWVTNDSPEGVSEMTLPGSMSGGLHQASAWLERLTLHKQQIPLNQPETILAVLRSSVAVLKTLTRDLSDEVWKFRSTLKDASILESVSHLCDVEIEIHHSRIQQILNHVNPFISGFDSDAWIIDRDYQNKRSKLDLQEFFKIRVENVKILATLNEQEWQRTAEHSFFGPTTLLELMGFAAQHDINHIREIHARLQYLQAVRY